MEPPRAGRWIVTLPMLGSSSSPLSGLLVRLQLADGLEAVADGDAVRLGELDLRGHTGRRVVNTEGPQLGAAEHQLAADLQGQLTLLGDVVVHELREIDVRVTG